MTTKPESAAVQDAGVIKNVGLLNLSDMSRDEIASIKRIENVGTVLVPEGLTGLVEKTTVNVGSTIPIPSGSKLNVISGQVVGDGAILAGHGGDPDAILVVDGQVVLTSPVQEIGYKSLILSGQIVAPRGSEAAIGQALAHLSGQTTYFAYTPGMDVQIRTGQMKLSGEALANPAGGDNDLLMLIGQVVVVGPVENVGYQEVMLVGQLMAPSDSQGLMGAYLKNPVGQVGYYSNNNPRFFIGDDSFGPDFFDLLDEPITMVLMGGFTIERGVTPELLKQNVLEIDLLGSIEAAPEVLPMVQVLAKEKLGSISSLEDDALDT